VGGATGVHNPGEYEGISHVVGGSAGLPGKVIGIGADYFTSSNGEVQGLMVGPSVGGTLPPAGEFHVISPKYHVEQIILVDPNIMREIKWVLFKHMY
jgi:hypothetical protein